MSEPHQEWCQVHQCQPPWTCTCGRQPASEPAGEPLRRFLEWDALNPLPDPIPAPFADLPYWIAEMRAALAAAYGDTP